MNYVLPIWERWDVNEREREWQDAKKKREREKEIGCAEMYTR